MNDRKSKLPYCWQRESLVAWRDQTSHNIPLSQSLIYSKTPTLLSSRKAEEEGEEAAEEMFKARRVISWDLRNIQGQGEAASAHEEAVASYPEDLDKIINEGGYTTQ